MRENDRVLGRVRLTKTGEWLLVVDHLRLTARIRGEVR